jgi:beta-phosphoglucomutase-like phosphatase (HAD superfamily)
VRAALLDFDGTIVDLPVDWPGVRDDIAKLFGRYGIDDHFSPLHASIVRAFERLKVGGLSAGSRAYVRREVNRLVTDAEMIAAAGATEKHGAREFLRCVRDDGWATIVQTSNSVHCVSSVFDRLSLPAPDAVVGRETARWPKPHPAGVRQILRRLGIAPSEAAVIGDGDFDIQLGRAIGAQTIRVPNPKMARSGEWQPDIDATSLHEVSEILVSKRQLQGSVV